jgi:hypothetical protein
MRYIRCVYSLLCIALAAPHEAFVPPISYRGSRDKNETAELRRLYEDMRRFMSPPRNSTTTDRHRPFSARAAGHRCPSYHDDTAHDDVCAI